MAEAETETSHNKLWNTLFLFILNCGILYLCTISYAYLTNVQ